MNLLHKLRLSTIARMPNRNHRKAMIDTSSHICSVIADCKNSMRTKHADQKRQNFLASASFP